jgi:hypothetical protein
LPFHLNQSAGFILGDNPTTPLQAINIGKDDGLAEHGCLARVQSLHTADSD